VDVDARTTKTLLWDDLVEYGRRYYREKEGVG
jgi:hypothetical protein